MDEATTAFAWFRVMNAMIAVDVSPQCHHNHKHERHDIASDGKSDE